MPVRTGRVVVTPGGSTPYKVILEHHPSGFSEYPVSSIKEGEALIRGRLPGAFPAQHSDDWTI